jgi:Beta-ketoacyl synthase, N-terminal domain
MAPVPVDVVGLGCRFPESASPAEFWQNLTSGRDLVTEDDRRWPPGFLGTPKRFGKVRNWGVRGVRRLVSAHRVVCEGSFCRGRGRRTSRRPPFTCRAMQFVRWGARIRGAAARCAPESRPLLRQRRLSFGCRRPAKNAGACGDDTPASGALRPFLKSTDSGRRPTSGNGDAATGPGRARERRQGRTASTQFR